MPRFRTLLLITFVLLVLQASVIWALSGQAYVAIVSETVQAGLGLMCLLMFAMAYQRSGSTGRYCWFSLAVSIAITTVAQVLGISINLASLNSLQLLDNLLFFFSGIPLAMLLFVDFEEGQNQVDRLHFVDFIQVCAFWTCVYLYFSGRPLTAITTLGASPFGWNTSVVFDGVLAFSFAFRAVLGGAKIVRSLFGPMALYLLAAGLADSYAEVDSNHVQDGSWFDLVWSGLMVAPLLIGAMWNENARPNATGQSRTQRIIVDQFFPLLYPFCSLLLLTQIAGHKKLLSAFLIVMTFGAIAIRMLVIQHRLLEAQETLSFEATHDSLTSLLNRGEILRRLEIELERQRRTGQSFSLASVDVDHFKNINDTYGHPVGDQVLHEIAHSLVKSLRPYDSVGRCGGEEFLIVIPGCDGQEAFATVDRLLKNIAVSLISTSAGSIPVTVSAGLITSTGASQSLDSSLLLRMADEALYRAKANGRNRVESAIFWSEDTKEHSGKRISKVQAVPHVVLT